MDNDGDSQGRGRSQQNGSDGRSGRGGDGLDGPEAAVDARREQADTAAAAPEAEVVQTNGADAQPDMGAGEQPDMGAGEQPDVGAGDQPDADYGKPDDAQAAPSAPKRRTGRGKGRSTRTASKIRKSDGDAAGPNGADASDGDVPPTEE
ncbi:MAG: hypothetical protein OEN55_05345 [Alphaproteobacteria bacterium]|nr:hypothetical protein [Alphaproteobacteria bacterium]